VTCRPRARPVGLRVVLALVGPTSLSVLSLLFAAVVSALTWFAFTFDQGFLCTAKDMQTHGAAVAAAVVLVLFGGLLEALSMLFLHRRRTALLATILLATGTLGLAMTLVAFDSATWSWIDSRGDCGRETQHVEYLYHSESSCFRRGGSSMNAGARDKTRSLRARQLPSLDAPDANLSQPAASARRRRRCRRRRRVRCDLIVRVPRRGDARLRARRSRSFSCARPLRRWGHRPSDRIPRRLARLMPPREFLLRSNSASTDAIQRAACVVSFADAS
jgi:hypothetical protein